MKLTTRVHNTPVWNYIHNAYLCLHIGGPVDVPRPISDQDMILCKVIKFQHEVTMSRSIKLHVLPIQQT